MNPSAIGRGWVRAGAAGLLALAAAAATPAPTSAVTVAEPGMPTAVREYAGTIVFSQFDQATRRWYLSVRRAGEAAERLRVASSPVPFNADIGTDSSGRSELIYQRCGAAGNVLEPQPVHCELFVYSLVAATGERPVRNANDPNHNDVDPTLWHGRIAWTREYGSGKNANAVVYTKTLAAPRSQPSTRLPGVPQSHCIGKVCEPTTYRRVEALELSGDNLAVAIDYTCNRCPARRRANFASTRWHTDPASEWPQ